MRSGLFAWLLSVPLLALGSGCKAGNACGDPNVVCRAQCKGGPEDNICFNDRVCVDDEWICYCRACAIIDGGPKDLSIPHDLITPSDLVSSPD